MPREFVARQARESQCINSTMAAFLEIPIPFCLIVCLQSRWSWSNFTGSPRFADSVSQNTLLDAGLDPNPNGTVLIAFHEEQPFVGRLEDPVDEVLGGRRRDVQVPGDVAVRKKSGLKTHLEDPPFLGRKRADGRLRRLSRLGRPSRPWLVLRLSRPIRPGRLIQPHQEGLPEIRDCLVQLHWHPAEEFACVLVHGAEACLDAPKACRNGRLIRTVRPVRPCREVRGIALQLPGQPRQFAGKVLHA